LAAGEGGAALLAARIVVILAAVAGVPVVDAIPGRFGLEGIAASGTGCVTGRTSRGRSTSRPERARSGAARWPLLDAASPP